MAQGNYLPTLAESLSLCFHHTLEQLFSTHGLFSYSTYGGLVLRPLLTPHLPIHHPSHHRDNVTAPHGRPNLRSRLEFRHS